MEAPSRVARRDGLRAAMFTGENLIRSTMEIWSSGFDGRVSDEERFDRFATFRDITAATPVDARILLRGSRPSLGLDRDVWLDLQWGQAASACTRGSR